MNHLFIFLNISSLEKNNHANKAPITVAIIFCNQKLFVKSIFNSIDVITPSDI